jgi:hypothetical protein
MRLSWRRNRMTALHLLPDDDDDDGDDDVTQTDALVLRKREREVLLCT